MAQKIHLITDSTGIAEENIMLCGRKGIPSDRQAKANCDASYGAENFCKKCFKAFDPLAYKAKPDLPRYDMPVWLKVIEFQQKKLAVMKAIPEIPCSGTDDDGEYSYTQAPDVIEAYQKEFKKVGFLFRALKVTCEVVNERVFLVHATYRITDADTGYYEDHESVGAGVNGVWSPTSAMTFAKKAGVLDTFFASYRERQEQKLSTPQNADELSKMTDLYNFYHDKTDSRADRVLVDRQVRHILGGRWPQDEKDMATARTLDLSTVCLGGFDAKKAGPKGFGNHEEQAKELY